MKNAFQKWYTYLFMFGLVVVAACVAIIPFFALNDPKIWPRVYISYTFLLSGVIYLGGGFIGQDVYRAFKRKETKNWDYPLEKKYVDKAWLIYMPFFLGGFILLISGLISYLILK